MQYKLVTLPEITLIGEKITTTAGSSDIAALWRRIGPQLAQYGASATRYAVCFNLATPPGRPTNLEYMAAKEKGELTAAPADMTVLTLPRREYYLFEHHGTLATYPQTIRAVIETAREQGLKFDHSYDLERYDERFRLNEPDSILEMLFPVKPD